MARPSGVGSVVAAVVQALRAATAVTALVPATRVLDEVPGATARPLLQVSVVSESADDVLSAGGIDALVSVLVVSEYRGSDEIGRIATAVREALDGRALTVDGFLAPADVLYAQAVGQYTEDVAGVQVRYRPLLFQVRAV